MSLSAPCRSRQIERGRGYRHKPLIRLRRITVFYRRALTLLPGFCPAFSEFFSAIRQPAYESLFSAFHDFAVIPYEDRTAQVAEPVHPGFARTDMPVEPDLGLDRRRLTGEPAEALTS